MTFIHRHDRRAHWVRAHFRDGIWIPTYLRSGSDVMGHFRRT